MFVEYITVNTIDINARIKVQVNGLTFYSLIEFACFCGSLYLLKYFLINNVEIQEKADQKNVLNLQF